MYDKIKKWYQSGLWSAEMVRQAARKGIITAEQAEAILSDKEAP